MKEEARWFAFSVQSSCDWRALLMDMKAFNGTDFHLELTIISFLFNYLLSKPYYKLLIQLSLLLIISWYLYV